MENDKPITAEQAADFRARNDRFHEWSERFRKPNGWKVITESEMATCPSNAVISNEERGLLEQFEVWRDKPEKLFAYVKFYVRQVAWRHGSIPMTHRPAKYDKAVVSTFMSNCLGTGMVNNVWRSNMGDWRAAITVSIAGQTYSGVAYLDSGDYCRLRRKKGR